MNATITQRKDGTATLTLSDGQTLRLPEHSLLADEHETEVVILAAARSRKDDEGALARAIVNQLLS